MNVGPVVAIRFPARDRLIHIAGLVDNIRRGRRIWFWRLFNHAQMTCKNDDH